MANRNFNGVQINQSVTITERAGADIEDARNRIMAYDQDGNVVLAADGSVVLVGVALIEDIGYILAGGDIAKGEEVTASNGLAVKAEAGNYVVGIALSTVAKDDYCRVQIAKYQKN